MNSDRRQSGPPPSVLEAGAISFPTQLVLHRRISSSWEEIDMPKTDALVRSTGQDRAEWFALLDEWGAGGREFREIADWLTSEHAVSRWWAQKLIVEYEQERGLRSPGVRPDGTFEVTASKTVAVPVDRLFDAFVDSR